MHLRYDRTELAHHREMLFTGPGAAEFINGVILGRRNGGDTGRSQHSAASRRVAG
jgi:hypothetical protein